MKIKKIYVAASTSDDIRKKKYNDLLLSVEVEGIQKKFADFQMLLILEK